MLKKSIVNTFCAGVNNVIEIDTMTKIANNTTSVVILLSITLILVSGSNIQNNF